METNTKKRVAAIDIVIILLLVCAVVGVGFKVFAGNVGLFAGNDEEYYISYVIEGADSDMGKLITNGTMLYSDNDEYFGAVVGDVITTPAKIYNENSDGEYVLGYSSGSHIDIAGTLSVRGKMTEKGFVHSGDYYAAGMRIKLYGGGAAPEILITDIVKASQ